jgi:hypothetical protein
MGICGHVTYSIKLFDEQTENIHRIFSAENRCQVLVAGRHHVGVREGRQYDRHRPLGTIGPELVGQATGVLRRCFLDVPEPERNGLERFGEEKRPLW